MVNASQSFESPVFESRIEMAPISLIAFLLFCCFFWGGGGKETSMKMTVFVMSL